MMRRLHGTRILLSCQTFCGKLHNSSNADWRRNMLHLFCAFYFVLCILFFSQISVLVIFGPYIPNITSFSSIKSISLDVMVSVQFIVVFFLARHWNLLGEIFPRQILAMCFCLQCCCYKFSCFWLAVWWKVWRVIIEK